MPLKSIDGYIEYKGWVLPKSELEKYQEVPLDTFFEIRVKSCRKMNRERLSYALIRKKDNKPSAIKHSLDDLITMARMFYDSERRKYERDLDKILLEG